MGCCTAGSLGQPRTSRTHGSGQAELQIPRCSGVKTQEEPFTDSFKIISCVLCFFPFTNAEEIKWRDISQGRVTFLQNAL